MQSDLEVFERVCRALWGAGFDIAHTGAAGLQIGLRPQGVLIGWRAEDSIAACGVPCGKAAQRDDPEPGTSMDEVSRRAVTRAIEEILLQADFRVVSAEGDLLVRG
ncbi:hypothetical protein AB0D08_31495 [Kitasatospora sp. NPDC048540]|uniref:hypothetical protein n=1 Tax=unclassified Kitasatospora TaxID=2633591 RepID=UPI00053AE89F|nr:hypothetical protein [Kitasatospora sp. MBT63]